jgi:hypothetical protein
LTGVAHGEGGSRVFLDPSLRTRQDVWFTSLHLLFKKLFKHRGVLMTVLSLDGINTIIMERIGYNGANWLS